MTQDFLEGLTRHGISYEVRSNDVKPDEMTLSNGQKVRLVDQQKVVRWTSGKKSERFSYVVCKAEVIR